MGKIYVFIVAVICFACVLMCDYLLRKVPDNIGIGRLVKKENVRMGISYFCGIIIFLVGVRVLYVFF